MDDSFSPHASNGAHGRHTAKTQRVTSAATNFNASNMPIMQRVGNLLVSDNSQLTYFLGQLGLAEQKPTGEQAGLLDLEE